MEMKENQQVFLKNNPHVIKNNICPKNNSFISKSNLCIVQRIAILQAILPPMQSAALLVERTCSNFNHFRNFNTKNALFKTGFLFFLNEGGAQNEGGDDGKHTINLVWPYTVGGKLYYTLYCILKA